MGCCPTASAAVEPTFAPKPTVVPQLMFRQGRPGRTAPSDPRRARLARMTAAAALDPTYESTSFITAAALDPTYESTSFPACVGRLKPRSGGADWVA